MANTPLPTNLDVDIWASGAVEPDFKLDPESVKYAEGWVVELARVDYENYIQNRQDQALANIVENGVPHWETTITYQRQSTARSPIDSYTYVAINNGIVGGSDPSADVSGNWIRQDKFTSDSITQSIQTFADSSLNSVNFDTMTKVLNKDGSNLETASGSSLVANRDLTNVTGESLRDKMQGSNAVTLSVVNDKVNIDVATIRSVAHDYLSSASDANTLALTAVQNQQAPTVYFAEMTIGFRYPATFTENTGPVFINLNNLGSVELKNLIGDSLTAGALRQDDHIEAIYDLPTNTFLVRSNRSDQGGAFGNYIAHVITATNSVTASTVVTAVNLVGTPLEHCKTLVVQVSIDNASDSTGEVSGGTRVTAAPLQVTSLLANDQQMGMIKHINQITVTADDLELFTTNPAFTAGTLTTTAEIVGGYR